VLAGRYALVGETLLAERAWGLAQHAAVGLVPVLVHVALVGPVTAIEGMVVDPVVRLRGGRDLPRPSSWDRLDGFLQRVAELDPPMRPLPSPAPSRSLFLWFFLLLAVTIGVVAAGVVAVRRRGGDGRSGVLLAGALVALGIVPQALQRADSTHLAWVSVVVLPLAVLAALELAPRSWPGSTGSPRRGTGSWWRRAT